MRGWRFLCLSMKAKKALKGNRGPQGATGATGSAGATGPQGATGAQGQKGDKGDNGDKGDKGDIGPSTAYHAEHPYSGAATPLPGNAFATLHTLNLRAGNYVVTGTATVYNGGASNNAAVCDLVPSAGNADRFVATAIPNQYAAASATMTVTLPSTGTVAFKCIGNTGVSMYVRQSTLTAINVGTILKQ